MLEHDNDDGGEAFPIPISKRHIVSKGFAAMQASCFNNFVDISNPGAPKTTVTKVPPEQKTSLENITNSVAVQPALAEKSKSTPIDPTTTATKTDQTKSAENPVENEEKPDVNQPTKSRKRTGQLEQNYRRLNMKGYQARGHQSKSITKKWKKDKWKTNREKIRLELLKGEIYDPNDKAINHNLIAVAEASEEGAEESAEENIA